MKATLTPIVSSSTHRVYSFKVETKSIYDLQGIKKLVKGLLEHNEILVEDRKGWNEQ